MTAYRNPLVAALLAHFDAHRRDLPWRDRADPYAIWVSEIMLQQTRVDTVRPYYERWLRRFPTLHALADADLDEVLGEWQGLGYYARARNLHRAARVVRERYGGDLPADPAELRRLPGIGEYTAGAVASIAFGIPAPAVDGNVRRVLARLNDLEYPTPSELRELARGLVPDDRPGDFNQALMELGATICTPRSPDCPACPVAPWCAARQRGVQEERPRPVRRGPVPDETVETSIIVRADGAVLLQRRPEDGMLGGLWEFPGQDAPPWLAELQGGARRVHELEPVVHVFSHKRVTYVPTVHVLDDGAGEAGDTGAVGEVAWVALAAMDDYALPVAQRKMAAAARVALSGP